MREGVGRQVSWSQFNGIVCHGEVLADVVLDGVAASLVLYWYDPLGDPPRRSYRLVRTVRLQPVGIPSSFLRVHWEEE